MKKLKDVPADQLEKAIGFYTRDKSGAQPVDYLNQFLAVARQYGYATKDDSWGELEKELAIAFRRLERYKRYLNSQIYLAIEQGDERPVEDIREAMLAHGECFWDDLQRIKQFDY